MDQYYVKLLQLLIMGFGMVLAVVLTLMYTQYKTRQQGYQAVVRREVTQRIERYRILRRLRACWLSEDFEAVDETDHHRVVLRVIRAELAHDLHLVDALRSEPEVHLAIAAKLPGAALVEFERTSVDPRTQRAFAVYRMAEGNSLLSEMERGYRPPLGDITAILKPIAAVLDTAAELGSPHRSLRPDKVYLKRAFIRARAVDYASVESASLIDFSPASYEFQASENLDASTFGDLAYMAPEQRRGEPVRGRPDVYAFGCIVYQMLTSYPPFRSLQSDPRELMRLHAVAPVPALPVWVPAEIGEVVFRALEKDPARRPESCTEMVDVIEAAALRLAASAASAGSTTAPPTPAPTPVPEPEPTPEPVAEVVIDWQPPVTVEPEPRPVEPALADFEPTPSERTPRVESHPAPADALPDLPAWATALAARAAEPTFAAPLLAPTRPAPGAARGGASPAAAPRTAPAARLTSLPAVPATLDLPRTARMTVAAAAAGDRQLPSATTVAGALAATAPLRHLARGVAAAGDLAALPAEPLATASVVAGAQAAAPPAVAAARPALSRPVAVHVAGQPAGRARLLDLAPPAADLQPAVVTLLSGAAAAEPVDLAVPDGLVAAREAIAAEAAELARLDDLAAAAAKLLSAGGLSSVSRVPSRAAGTAATRLVAPRPTAVPLRRSGKAPVAAPSRRVTRLDDIIRGAVGAPPGRRLVDVDAAERAELAPPNLVPTDGEPLLRPAAEHETPLPGAEAQLPPRPAAGPPAPVEPPVPELAAFAAAGPLLQPAAMVAATAPRLTNGLATPRGVQPAAGIGIAPPAPACEDLPEPDKPLIPEPPALGVPVVMVPIDAIDFSRCDWSAGAALVFSVPAVDQVLRGFAFDPTGSKVCLIGREMAPVVWCLESGRALFTVDAAARDANAVAWSPDGRWLAFGVKRHVLVWSAAEQSWHSELIGHHADRPVRAVAFTPDGDSLVSAGDDADAIRWDYHTCRELCRYEGHDRAIWDLAFLPDGERFVTAGADSMVRFWDLDSGVCKAALRAHSQGLIGVAVSDDGRQMATCSKRGTAKLWDLEARDLKAILRGHANRVVQASFSPDGERLATACLDSRVRVWDTSTGRDITRFKVPRVPCRGARFNPDGRTLASVWSDGGIRVWAPRHTAEAEAALSAAS